MEGVVDPTIVDQIEKNDILFTLVSWASCLPIGKFMVAVLFLFPSVNKRERNNTTISSVEWCSALPKVFPLTLTCTIFPVETAATK